MPKIEFKNIVNPLALIAIAILVGIFFGGNAPRNAIPAATQPVTPTPTLNSQPQTVSIPDSPLKNSVLAAGDFMVRQQLPNGDLTYQVDVMTDSREFSSSGIRLMAGTGSLFTVCRVSGNPKYCEAGDLALNLYLNGLITEPKQFAGTCFYSAGACQLGGSALTVDAIYKRWQAGKGYRLNNRDLLQIAKNLGYFIVSMRKPDGGFYHSFDPHYGGSVDPDYYVSFYPGEALMALMELYEMTGNSFWLTQAREVNDYMITRPVTEDHWHAYSLRLFARLDKLTKADREYARKIAEAVIAGEVRSLNPTNTSISTATKVEALAALAQALYLSHEQHQWLDPEIRTLITFVQARQLPDNNCNWTISDVIRDKFGGGIYSSCEEPSVRIDGLQHYINGATTYLEYKKIIE